MQNSTHKCRISDRSVSTKRMMPITKPCTSALTPSIEAAALMLMQTVQRLYSSFRESLLCRLAGILNDAQRGKGAESSQFNVYLPFWKSTLVCLWRCCCCYSSRVTSGLLKLISPGLGMAESAQRRPVVSIRPDLPTSALPLGSIGRPSGLDIHLLFACLIPPMPSICPASRSSRQPIVF